jgi:hypothetical protein
MNQPDDSDNSNQLDPVLLREGRVVFAAEAEGKLQIGSNKSRE